MIAHLINTDVGGRGIERVYLEYRLRNSDFLKRATDIVLSCKKRILIVTGFPIPPMNVPETDGPPGALALALGLNLLGMEVEIMTYEPVRKALSNLATFVEPSEVKVEEYSLVIGVEVPGRAHDGVARSMSGLPIKTEIFDWVFIEATSRQIPTIGIGDGGNEVGMGNIRELIEKYIPLGKLVASSVKTNELITAGVSNWGAYGLLGELSIATGKNLLDSIEFNEREVVKKLIKKGIIDGVTKRPSLSIDGIGIDLHENFMEFLKRLVRCQVLSSSC